MNTLIKLYLRPFLITGLTFGLLLAIWDYFDKGKIDYVKLIFMSVAFGVLMSCNMVTIKKRRQKDSYLTPEST